MNSDENAPSNQEDELSFAFSGTVKAPLSDLIFTNDEKYVITCSGDGTARIWPLLVNDVLEKVNIEKERGDMYELLLKDKKAYGIIE